LVAGKTWQPPIVGALVAPLAEGVGVGLLDGHGVAVGFGVGLGVGFGVGFGVRRGRAVAAATDPSTDDGAVDGPRPAGVDKADGRNAAATTAATTAVLTTRRRRSTIARSLARTGPIGAERRSRRSPDEGPRQTIRYTPGASVRQNPRTAARVPSGRGWSRSHHHPCSTLSAIACARPSIP
jgi:hypothetical protein